MFTFVAVLISSWLTFALKPVDAYLFIRPSPTVGKPMDVADVAFNLVLFAFIVYLTHTLAVEVLNNERLFVSLMFIFTLLLLSGSPLVVRADDSYCFNHEVKSTKAQCEEHHCFYDPYLERCFFSLEHARASYPCSHFSGNLSMSGLNNEEACAYHWCIGRVSKIDNVFMCGDPSFGDLAGIDKAIVSGGVHIPINAHAKLYDPLPLEYKQQDDPIETYYLSITDDLKLTSADHSNIMIDYNNINVIALNSSIPEIESVFRLPFYINNFSYPIQKIHDTLPSRHYSVVVNYIYRAIMYEHVHEKPLKGVVTTKQAPVYQYEYRFTSFDFYLGPKPARTKEPKQDTEIDIPMPAKFLIGITISGVVLGIAFGCMNLYSCYSYYSKIDPDVYYEKFSNFKKRQGQEQILHDSVDDEEEEQDCVAFHTRNRMINGELLELDSSSSDDDEEEQEEKEWREEDGRLTLE
jgi:hypothetical protein